MARKATKIVLGISSVGKSTYIAGKLRDKEHASVLFGSLEGSQSADDNIVHYNLLRPFDNLADNFYKSLESDPSLHQLFPPGETVECEMLVCSLATLIRRMLLREEVEPVLLTQTTAYPTKMLFEFLSRIPLMDIYQRWIDWLEQHGQQATYISTEDNYEQISKARALEILSDKMLPNFSAAERDVVLNKFSFPYQQRDGAPRSETLKIIQPYFAGKSALDIGCAEGRFCFALEDAGFDHVLGTEPKLERFLAANAMKVTTGSSCNFRLTDIIPETEQFDTVLMLNVIHHLKAPVSGLRSAAHACNKTLIIEFPTLSDPKFSATTESAPEFTLGLPLIGVSLSGKDQTFVFSDEAIRRILLDHDQLFSSVDFLPSPIAERRTSNCDLPKIVGRIRHGT